MIRRGVSLLVEIIIVPCKGRTEPLDWQIYLGNIQAAAEGLSLVSHALGKTVNRPASVAPA